MAQLGSGVCPGPVTWVEVGQVRKEGHQNTNVDAEDSPVNAGLHFSEKGGCGLGKYFRWWGFALDFCF